MRIVLQFAVILSLMPSIMGCGIAHVKAHVPQFSVAGEIVGNHERGKGSKAVPVYLTIVAPSFYDSVDAFLALVDSRFEADLNYEKIVLSVDPSGRFNAKIKAEDRYIGFLVLFPKCCMPSKESTEIRELFIFPHGVDFIYRVTLRGMSAFLRKRACRKHAETGAISSVRRAHSVKVESIRNGSTRKWTFSRPLNGNRLKRCLLQT
jgi:hypothetical protein